MIKFENVCKTYKSKNVIHNINFSINKGELVVLIGPSGCGKTTTLKMINRLIKISSGKIFINDKDITKEDVIKLRRNMGYVIQQTGLFPHMTIQENIEIIPKLQKQPISEIVEKTLKLMDMIGLDSNDYLDRYPTQLSGGQQQRIGVARAFASDPDIILMDEPFSALDPISRSQLQDEIITLQAKFKKTIVFVTHDMDEAIKIADRICIMNHGSIVQYDTPENILKNPINDFVNTFVGENRIWSNPEFIKASDIMITEPVTIYSQVPMIKAMEKMRLAKVDAIIVTDDNNKYVGLVRAKKIHKFEDKKQPIVNAIGKKKIVAYVNDSIIDLLNIIKEKNISNIPIVDKNNKVKGIVTNSTLVTTLSQQFINFDDDEEDDD